MDTQPLVNLASLLAAAGVVTFLALLPMIFRRAQVQLQRERIADQDSVIEGMREELADLREQERTDREQLAVLIKRERETGDRVTKLAARLYRRERYIGRLEAKLAELGVEMPRNGGEG